MTEEKPEIRNLTAMSMKDLEGKLAAANEKIESHRGAIAEATETVREAREKIEQLQESRAQAIEELDAARKTANGAMAREKAAEKLRAETNTELTKTIAQLANATTFRDRYKEERDELRRALSLATDKIRILKEAAL